MWAIYSVQIQRVSCHICLLGNKYFFETVMSEQKITKIYRLVNPTTLYQDPGIQKPNKISTRTRNEEEYDKVILTASNIKVEQDPFPRCGFI